MIMPCFVNERRHKEGKRIANDIRNTSVNFEKSLLEDITNNHMANLEASDFSVRPGILGGSRPSDALLATLRNTFPHCANLRVGKRARFSEWGEAQTGDVLEFVSRGRPFLVDVAIAVQADGDVFFLGQVYEQCSESRYRTKFWTPCATETLIAAGLVAGPRIHRRSAERLISLHQQ